MFNIMKNTLDKANEMKQFLTKGEWVELTPKELSAHYLKSLIK